MVINTNMLALTNMRNMGRADQRIAQSMNRISSGLRIARAKDNPAGLAISNKMMIQISNTQRATNNSLDGISLVQTAEGGLSQIHDILQRMRELSVQALNDTNTAEDKAKMQSEIEQLSDEIDGIATRTGYNTINLLARTNGIRVGGLNNVLGSGGMSSAPNLSEPMAFNAITNSTGSPVVGSYNAGYPGYSGEPGKTYGSAWLDFSGLGTSFQLSDLKSEGFCSTCATCNKYYSIKFVSGTGTNYVPDYNTPRLEIGIDGCANGKDLTERIINAIKASPEFNNHYTQYAIDKNNPAKLYMYDNRSEYANNGGGSTFEPTVMGDIPENVPDSVLIFQVGPNKGHEFRILLCDARTAALNLENLDLSTITGANNALARLDSAISQVSVFRTRFGVYQNRFEHIYQYLEIKDENIQSSLSTVRDTDVAYEMTVLTKSQVISQAGMSLLAQANMMPQQLLQLIK